LARALVDAGVGDAASAAAIERACERVDASQVAAEEARTKHNIRALVNVIRAGVPRQARPLVHLGATSNDILDTANALRYRECVEHVVLRRLGRLTSRCIALAESHADTPQIGRTHGQHAVPITFGFAMAEYVSRLGGRMLALRAAAAALPGKLAGAVGAYNAFTLLVDDPRQLERRFLGSLGLRPASHSTQIVEPEGWSDLAHACVTAMGVMANVADDMRQLQRTEIAEIAEAVDEAQVGSSTMPQKRNPVSFENVKSIFKAMAPRVVTTYLDQISEHQRDLTNSASQRFLTELIAACAYAAGRLEESLAGIRVDAERMHGNLASSTDRFVAEPLYVLLARHGHDDAHEAVRRLVREADGAGQAIIELAADRPEMAEAFRRLSRSERHVLERPAEYRGLAAEVARETCAIWRERLREYLPA
jgi:adenylosuccinate lyase